MLATPPAGSKTTSDFKMSSTWPKGIQSERHVAIDTSSILKVANAAR